MSLKSSQIDITIGVHVNISSDILADINGDNKYIAHNIENFKLIQGIF